MKNRFKLLSFVFCCLLFVSSSLYAVGEPEKETIEEGFICTFLPFMCSGDFDDEPVTTFGGGNGGGNEPPLGGGNGGNGNNGNGGNGGD